jgi:multiple sugar transport system substrate-binding protein
VKKIKIVLAGLLSAAMVLSLSACAGSKTNATNSSTKPVTIEFANYALLEAGYTDFWNGVKTGFEKKYPNITIKWVTAPYADVVTQVVNMAGGGDKVDMMFGELEWAATLQDAGLAVPVDKVLPSSFLSDIYPSALNAGDVNSKPYAIPMDISPFVLYYNKDIFTAAGLDPTKPPKTYDEMMSMADNIAKLKTADGNKIYPFGQTTASVAVSGASLTAMVYNFGGSVLTKDGKLNVDNNFTTAFNMLKTLDEKGYNPQNAKLKDLRNLFALGQLAMYYDQSWGYVGVKSINPKAAGFTASAAPLSGGSGTGESLLQAEELILMNDSSAKKDAISKLVEYIMSSDVLGPYLTNVTPAYPARKSMASMTAITDSPVLKGAASSLDKAIAGPSIPALSDLDLDLCTLAQDITVSGQTVDQGISKFKTSANALLAK